MTAQEQKSNLKYLLSKGILDILLKDKVITLEEYEKIDKLNRVSFA